MPIGRKKDLALVLAVTSLTMLGGCDENPRTRRFASPAECEKVNGLGNCARPEPVEMTALNRPSYGTEDECQRDFGEQACETERQGDRTLSRPIYYAGTYFYPAESGHRGYYFGPDGPPVGTTSTRVPTVAPPVTGAASNFSVARNGFGTTALRMGSSSS